MPLILYLVDTRLWTSLSTILTMPHFLVGAQQGCQPASLIGTIRREFLDRPFFWNALDLERKLQAIGGFCNGSRVHLLLGGSTPEEEAGKARPGCATLGSFGWREHCRGLSQTPIAA